MTPEKLKEKKVGKAEEGGQKWIGLLITQSGFVSSPA
jgi:hypothetical protein